MRTLPVVLLLGLFSITVHAQKSDRDRDGFRGPVKAVRTEHTWAATRDGKYVEGERGIPAVHSYDASGNKIEIAYYNIDGSPGNKLVYTRNLGRKVTELVHYGPDGIPHYKSVYTHDNEGNIIEQTDHKADGSLNVKWVRTYDERGNKTKEVMYGGGRVLRTDEWTYSYDKRGNINEVVNYYDSEKSGRTVYTYDNSGNVVESSWYGTDGSLLKITRSHSDRTWLAKQSFVHEFDSRGNWTKQVMSRWDIKANRFEPEEVTYRTITYY